MFDFSLFAAELRKVHPWVSYIVNISVKKLKKIKSSEESKNQFSWIITMGDRTRFKENPKVNIQIVNTYKSYREKKKVLFYKRCEVLNEG